MHLHGQQVYKHNTGAILGGVFELEDFSVLEIDTVSSDEVRFDKKQTLSVNCKGYIKDWWPDLPLVLKTLLDHEIFVKNRERERERERDGEREREKEREKLRDQEKRMFVILSSVTC